MITVDAHVSVPVIVGQVLGAVYFAVGAMLGLRLRVRLVLRRRNRYVSLICTWGIGTVGLRAALPLFMLSLAGMTLIGRLSEGRESCNQNQGQGKAETCPHSSSPKDPNRSCQSCTAATGQGVSCPLNVPRVLLGTTRSSLKSEGVTPTGNHSVQHTESIS